VLDPKLTQSLGGPLQWASLRPESIRLHTGPNSGTVSAVRYLGSGTRVVLQVGKEAIAALIPAGQAVPNPGSTVQFGFEATDLHVLDKA
jgi:putative spermidine/putrescine transport system ATP-binding protein